jgi:hypothetical protein
MSYLQLTKELIWKDDHNRGKHDVKAINLWYKTPKNVWMEIGICCSIKIEGKDWLSIRTMCSSVTLDLHTSMINKASISFFPSRHF